MIKKQCFHRCGLRFEWPRLLPRVLPLSLPQTETHSKCRRKPQRQGNKNWLEPTGPKVAGGLASSGP